MQCMYLISTASLYAINDMPLHSFRFAMHFSATCFADCAVISMLLDGLIRAKLLFLQKIPGVIVLSMTFRAYTTVMGPNQIGGSIRIQTIMLRRRKRSNDRLFAGFLSKRGHSACQLP